MALILLEKTNKIIKYKTHKILCTSKLYLVKVSGREICFIEFDVYLYNFKHQYFFIFFELSILNR